LEEGFACFEIIRGAAPPATCQLGESGARIRLALDPIALRLFGAQFIDRFALFGARRTVARLSNDTRLFRA
jgi:hypothetical protein